MEILKYLYLIGNNITKCTNKNTNKYKNFKYYILQLRLNFIFCTNLHIWYHIHNIQRIMLWNLFELFPFFNCYSFDGDFIKRLKAKHSVHFLLKDWSIKRLKAAQAFKLFTLSSVNQAQTVDWNKIKNETRPSKLCGFCICHIWIWWFWWI